MAKKLITDRERFFRSITKDKNGCWVWQLAKQTWGYGAFALCDNGVKSQVSAHRWAYEQFVGRIPDHLQLDHLCRNRACCNPDHLDLVTGRENSQRGINHTKLYCKHGHPLFGDNLRLRANGHRQCKMCILKTMREFRKSNPERVNYYNKKHYKNRRRRQSESVTKL